MFNEISENFLYLICNGLFVLLTLRSTFSCIGSLLILALRYVCQELFMCLSTVWDISLTFGVLFTTQVNSLCYGISSWVNQ